MSVPRLLSPLSKLKLVSLVRARNTKGSASRYTATRAERRYTRRSMMMKKVVHFFSPFDVVCKLSSFLHPLPFRSITITANHPNMSDLVRFDSLSSGGQMTIPSLQPAREKGVPFPIFHGSLAVSIVHCERVSLNDKIKRTYRAAINLISNM